MQQETNRSYKCNKTLLSIKNYNDYETVFILKVKNMKKWHYAMNSVLLKYACQ